MAEEDGIDVKVENDHGCEIAKLGRLLSAQTVVVVKVQDKRD